MSFDEELFGLAVDFASSPELPVLKQRFKGFEACKDMATAAAFGYLAAMKDAEKKEEGPCIFDMLCTVFDQFLEEDNQITSEESTEIAMGLVYSWLNKEFIEEGFPDVVIDTLAEKFASYVKPGVIKD
jgi:hypothetical protein